MNLLYLNVFLRYLPGIGMYLAVVFGSKGSEGQGFKICFFHWAIFGPHLGQNDLMHQTI